MPRLRHHRHTDPAEDETPDWAWTEDADMPSDEEISRQALVQGYDRGRRSGDHPADAQHPLPLSPQQRDVLVCLSLGDHLQEAADRLGITLCAVKDSLKQARRKLDALTNEQTVANAIRTGQIE